MRLFFQSVYEKFSTFFSKHVASSLPGGALVLLLIEAARSKKFDKDTEALINYGGYVILVLLGIYLFNRDLAAFVMRR